MTAGREALICSILRPIGLLARGGWRCYPPSMDYLRVDSRPELRSPVAICAFSGWNDAGTAATNAARFVVRRLGARKFASFDPEPFFDFTASRPAVRMTPGFEREIQWPANEFFFARNPAGPHDIVVFVGTEPGLRWKQFTGGHARLYSDLGVDLVVSVGALLADVPHTRGVRVTGNAMDARLSAELDLQPSTYEGPTGIVGALHDTLKASGLRGASLWANVPHYISTSQNPPATAAILRRLESLTGLEFDLSELEAAGGRFSAEVEAALAGNDEVSRYVARLEEAFDASTETPERPPLPRGEQIVLDVEEYLRRQRKDEPGD